MAQNDIYLVRETSDGTFEEIANSPFRYDASSNTDLPDKANNTFHINTKLRVDELEVNGDTTVIHTDANTTEQLSVTNDGTGPAAIINQIGAEPLIDIQDDGVSAFFIEDGGNVGIGITNPSHSLHVKGSMKVENDGASPLIEFADTSGFSRWTGLVDGTSKFAIYGTDGSTQDFVIDGGGNVGIGTTSPTAPLTIVEQDNVALKMLKSSGQTLFTIGEDGNNNVELNSSTVDLNGTVVSSDLMIKGGNLQVESGTSTWLKLTSGLGTFSLGSASYDMDSNGVDTKKYFSIYDDDVSEHRIWINEVGSVGIGTTAPLGNLDVVSDSNSGTNFYIQNTFDPAVNCNWRFQADSNGDFNIGVVTSSFYKRLQFTPTGAISIPNGILNIGDVDSGSVGIGLGAHTPARKLEIYGDRNAFIRLTNQRTSESDSQILGGLEFASRDTSGDPDNPGAGVRSSIKATSQFADGTGGNLVFSTATATSNEVEAMRIDSDGNVGIGTTSPTAPLTIVEQGNVALKMLKSSGQTLFTIGEDGDNNVELNSSTVDLNGTVVPSNLVIKGGSVCIGTTASPWGTLQIDNITGDGTPNIDAWNQSTDSENAHSIIRTAVKPGGGDAYFRAVVDGENEWSFGLDSSDGNSFKINSSGLLGADGGTAGDRLTITTGGNVGIGTTNPSAKLEVRSSQADETASFLLAEGGGDTGGILISTNTASTYRVNITHDDTGFVFSNNSTTSPKRPWVFQDGNLEVNGDIHFTGDLYQNGSLFSGSGAGGGGSSTQNPDGSWSGGTSFGGGTPSSNYPNPLDVSGDTSTGTSFTISSTYDDGTPEGTGNTYRFLSDTDGGLKIGPDGGDGTSFANNAMLLILPEEAGGDVSGAQPRSKLSVRNSYLEVLGHTDLPAGSSYNQNDTELKLLTHIGNKSTYCGYVPFDFQGLNADDTAPIYYFHLAFRGSSAGNMNGFKYKAEIGSSRFSTANNATHWVNTGFVTDESFVYFEDDLDYYAGNQHMGIVNSVGDIETVSREVYPTRDDSGELWGMKALPADSNLTIDNQTNYIVRYGMRFGKNFLYGSVPAENAEKEGRLYIQLEVMHAGHHSWGVFAPHFVNVPASIAAANVTGLVYDEGPSTANRMHFGWNAVPGAGRTYRVQLATDSGFTNLIHSNASYGATSDSVSGLTPNTLYYVRVKANPIAGEDVESSNWITMSATTKT